MLNFTDLSIRRGKRLLFSGATFSLFRGEKVGITGENGSGKSSLMALVRGEVLNRITVPESIAAPARIALERMLALRPTAAGAVTA